MLKGIDISNWQAGLELSDVMPDFVIVKATEGTTFADPYKDMWCYEADKLEIPFGFYHFARNNDPEAEAQFFYSVVQGNIRNGIPILDYEVQNSNEWIDSFVQEFHRLSNVWPWVYMNSNYVNNLCYGSDYVKEHCGLWLAGYPWNYIDYPDDTSCPYKHEGWTLAAWQFTDSLKLSNGMSVDGNIFYGDVDAWKKYADPDTTMFDIEQAALDVIAGKYGNGQERKDMLGKNYKPVQDRVNWLLHIADAVIAGKYGNGSDRKANLGSDYESVQKVVNMLLSDQA